MIHAGVEPASRLFRQRALLVGQMDHDGAGDGNRTHIASLEGWDSTIELHPHYGATDRNRTYNLLITSQLLYLLSYDSVKR